MDEDDFAPLANEREEMLVEIACLRQSLHKARELIEELASAAVEFEDPRIDYKTLQVPTIVIRAAKKWLEDNK